MAGAIMAGRFQKVSRIGRGTFGEAWLVTSTCSGRRYVIKEVRVDQMSDEELETTRREATILARCKHSSIIRYKEYFMLENPATMCLVMEYADGGDLSLRVKETKRRGELMDEEDILYWFVQVIFAVQYLHVNNILHRDLKTQNVFLTKSNLVKVGDFGIARFLRDEQDLAMTAIGTPYYLSPEICQRRPYNHKSDMWAVGCILYELCALNHPFQAKYFDDLIISILRGSYKPLPRKFSSLVRDLTRVMLRTNPDRRPTADALLMLPGLKPYVENYLVKHEELLAHRPSTKHPQKVKEEEHNVLALKKDGLFKDVFRINTIKKSPRQGRGSIDLGQIQPRKQQGFESNSEGSLVSKGERHRNAFGVGVGHRPRCVSDSALERDATPTTPVIATEGITAPKGLSSGSDFKTPPRVLRRRKKKKRADTPMPKTARKTLYGRQEEEEEEEEEEQKRGQRDGKQQPQEKQEKGKQQREEEQQRKQKQQEEKHQRRQQQQQREKERDGEQQPQVEQQREHQQQEEEQQEKQRQQEEETKQQHQQQNWSPHPLCLQDTLSGSESSGEELQCVRRRTTIVGFSGTYIIPRFVPPSSGSDDDSLV